MSPPFNWSERWPYFKPDEIFSDQQLALYMRGIFPYSFRSLDRLHDFRVFVGHPLICNSGGMNRRGARSISEVIEINRKTRGSLAAHGYSFHLWCAFDLSCHALSPDELYEKAIAFQLWGGIGRYDTFVHVDDRDNMSGQPTLWDNRTANANGPN